MKQKSNKKFNNLEVSFLVILTCIISLLVGYLIAEKKQDKVEDKTLNEFIKTYNEIIDKYYKDIDKEELLNGAVSGMLSTLDQHSVLVDQEEDENFYLYLNGSYSGIGIEISTLDNKIVVIGVIADSPAEKAGIQVGDIIKQIDDLDMKEATTKTVSSYIRKNTEKQEFDLVVIRNEEELQFKIKKENVVITSVASKVFERNDKKIGYIYISIFSSTTSSQFAKKLKELEQENIDALIIDVRENTGGHLSTAVSMLSMLLSQDKVMYQIEKDGKKSKYYSLGHTTYNKPVAIIQNGNSASASEMLAASLRDNLEAIIIGEKSYGKGSVQEYNYLSNGNMYKYTTKKWLTPKGKSIDEKGIKPDIEVSLDENYYQNPVLENDNQLETAIQKLLEKIN